LTSIGQFERTGFPRLWHHTAVSQWMIGNRANPNTLSGIRPQITQTELSDANGRRPSFASQKRRWRQNRRLKSSANLQSSPCENFCVKKPFAVLSLAYTPLVHAASLSSDGKEGRVIGASRNFVANSSPRDHVRATKGSRQCRSSIKTKVRILDGNSPTRLSKGWRTFKPGVNKPRFFRLFSQRTLRSRAALCARRAQNAPPAGS